MAVTDTKCSFVAAIFGVTGLVGTELAKKLLSTRKWKVYGIARRPNNIISAPREMSRHFVTEDLKLKTKTIEDDPNYHFISCDLLDSRETQEKLGSIEDLTNVFWVTWSSQFPLDSPECFDQNKCMMSHALNAILPSSKSLKHVSLQTGTKHYVSLQGNFTKNKDVFFEENSLRVSQGHNFYYALEDLLQERLPGYEVAWSINRPGIIMGCSNRTMYNFIGSLCVYGTICKYLNLPFVFGGSKECWEEMYVDASDARLVAEQHIWSATSIEASGREGEAFNSINGDNFSWKDIWGVVGVKLGANVLEDEKMYSEDFVFSSAMGDKGDVWKDIVAKEGLIRTEMTDLANWEFLDILFRYPMKMLGSRAKADRMGFKTRNCTLDSILYWIDVIRAEKFIP